MDFEEHLLGGLRERRNALWVSLLRVHGHRGRHRYNRAAVMQATNGRLVLSPSDLNDHVECAHLTTLSREAVLGTRPRPHVPEDHADLLRRKGDEHEAAYLADLRAKGGQVIDVIAADRWDFETSAKATEAAMRVGA